MKTFNTSQSNLLANPKGVGTNGTNVLDVLGNQKNLTPEQIKLLQKQGKLQGSTGEFETLFGKATQKNQKDPKLALAQQLKANQPKPHNKDVMGQEVELKNIVKKPLVGELALKSKNNKLTSQAQQHPQGETQVARVLKLGQSKNIKASAHNPHVAMGSKPQADSAQNIEAGLKTHQSLIPQINKQNMTALQNNAAQKNTVNSKLVDFNSFMQKQTPQVRGRIAAKSEMYQSEAKKSKSMFANKVDVNPMTTKKAVKTTSLQEVMLKNENESSENSNTQEQGLMNNKMSMKNSNINSAPKVFDLGQLNSNMGQNDMISKIQDYAIQTRAGNEPQLEVSFQHKDLGQVDLMIQKLQNNQLNISIGTNSVEASQFFNQNQGELLQTLTQAGLSIGDLKLESGKLQNQNLAGDFNRGSDQEQNQKQKQPGSESGERQEDQERRQELWNQFKDKEAA